jgi:acyl dehydratase
MSDGFSFPVDGTAIMLFASALGESNPIYYDEAHARATALGGVIAPPTFGVASAHWNPRHVFRGVRRIPAPAPSRAVEGSGTASRTEGGEGGSLARVLHGEQRFEYHEPLRPGMRLRVETRPGKSWEKEGRRGGTLRMSEVVSEYRDESGRLVLTATSVGIVTARAVEG